MYCLDHLVLCWPGRSFTAISIAELITHIVQ